MPAKKTEEVTTDEVVEVAEVEEKAPKRVRKKKADGTVVVKREISYTLTDPIQISAFLNLEFEIKE
ncbi:hypothetical protein HZZ02_07210 [Streptococcus danieliae]|nr:hypothetical protein [Streptococcus danieliae]